MFQIQCKQRQKTDMVARQDFHRRKGRKESKKKETRERKESLQGKDEASILEEDTPRNRRKQTNVLRSQEIRDDLNYLKRDIQVKTRQ